MKFAAELEILYFSASDIVTASEYQDDTAGNVPERQTRARSVMPTAEDEIKLQ